MTRRFQNKIEYEKLLEYITDSLIQKGIKALTMDSLAVSLQMSKRTLYEIFGSKENMIEEALKNFHERQAGFHKKTFESSDNIMEAMVKSLLATRQMMSHASVDFFRDMESYFNDKPNKREIEEFKFVAIEKLFRLGEEQGFFRKGLNARVQWRILIIQMESLKNMEELFPPDITLLEVYDSICLGFLRAISSEKGLKYLDSVEI